MADFPDPDNFLHHSDMITLLNILSWKDAAYEQLLEQAARTSDSKQRLSMYRQADRILVHDLALIVPITYGGPPFLNLVKPWVKNFKPNALGNLVYQNIFIEEH